MTAADVVAGEAALPALLLSAVRPGAAFVAAPMFGAAQVPVFVRFVIALAIGVAGLPSFSAAGPHPLLSLVVVHEALVGLSLGFALQGGFSASLIAGEAIGNAMGIGFAAMTDPMTGRASPAIGQALSTATTALFLSVNGHLIFIMLIVESLQLIPPYGASGPDVFRLVTVAGTAMFAGALLLALPVIAFSLGVQLIMAMVGRAAPALNLFAVGLPAALLAASVMVALAFPIMARTSLNVALNGLTLARSIIG